MKRFFTHQALLSLIALGLASCSSSVQWIHTTPQQNQALAHIKAKAGQSQSMQKRTALLQAKAELAKQKQLVIYSKLLKTTKCDNKQCKSQLHTLSIQKSKEYMHGIKRVHEYLDPKDGSYYLLLQMDP